MFAVTDASQTRADGQACAKPRRFVFEHDSFAFPNELFWEYQFCAETGKTTFTERQPKPDYAHRCFVLTRAARQFLYHARFEPGKPAADDDTYRKAIRALMRRNPRTPCETQREVVIPGFAGLREFSQARAALLKAECGGAWQSYVLRSHWRMIFPISREHQVQTSKQLLERVRQNVAPLIHLIVFPSRAINHGMVIFDGEETKDGAQFTAYDPNVPEKPTTITFDSAQQTFFLPANRYWAGGKLDIIEIYNSWLM